MVFLMVLNRRLVYLNFLDWSEMVTQAEKIDVFLSKQNKLKNCNSNYIVHGTCKDDLKIGRYVTGFENFLPGDFKVLDLGPAQVDEINEESESFQTWEDTVFKFSKSSKDYFEILFSDLRFLMIRFCSDAK